MIAVILRLLILNLYYTKNILLSLSKIINICLGKEATMGCRYYFIFKKVLFFIIVHRTLI